jgi:hypothetical protein
MDVIDQAYQTQLKNIQARTGKSLDELYAFIRASGLGKHGEIRDLAKRELGLGHGDANTLAKFYLESLAGAAQAGGAPAEVDPVDEIYTGSKASLRPLHETVMALMKTFGPFEIAPKKGYLSLRRKRQFAMLGPGTKGRVEVGINMKGVAGTDRLIQQEPGGMCQYKVFLSQLSEVDGELAAWLRQAYDSAG